MITGTQLGWPVSRALGPTPRTVSVFECDWSRAKVGSADQEADCSGEREGLASAVLLKEITCGFKAILESWGSCHNSAL